jgi:hypothetical protein
MHIEILKDRTRGFQVRVVDANGRLIRMFIYATIESARQAAKAWTVAWPTATAQYATGRGKKG